MGPVGNGFDIKNKKSLLVGAGIGVAPISFLKGKLPDSIFFAGFLNKDEIIQGINADKIYTDDGSFGTHGFVTDVLEKNIHHYDIVVAIGPIPMMKAVSEVTKAATQVVPMPKFLKSSLALV